MTTYAIQIILPYETAHGGVPRPDMEHQLNQAKEISYNIRNATVIVCHSMQSHDASVTDARFRMGERVQ